MEQLPENGDKVNNRVRSYPAGATMKSDSQKSDIRTLQDWHDAVITVRTELQGNDKSEVILPDWSYLKSEPEREAEDPVNVETAEWSFKTRLVGRQQLTSVVEASFDPSIEIEDFSIKTELEEDLGLLVDLKDTEREENKELVRGKIKELISNQRKNVFKTDELTSGDQDELTAIEQGDQESSRKRKAEVFLCEENTGRITDGSNGSLCRNLVEGRLVQVPEKDEILKQNEDTPEEQQNICVTNLKDVSYGCSSEIQDIAYRSKTPFQCDLCRKEIPQSSNDDNHTSLLTGQTPNSTCRKEKWCECQYSEHRFTETSNICKHIQNVNLEQKLYLCHQCGQTFESRFQLKCHLETIHFKMKHDCPHCGQTFTKNCDMEIHVQTVHLKKKIYECEHCGQRFGVKSSVYKHIRRVHLKEKQSECQYCGQKFGQNSDRDRHIRILHLKDKPYECPQCGQRFTSKRSLASHVQRVHI